MGITRAVIQKSLAVVAAVIIAPVGGQFFVSLAEESGWYKNPSTRVSLFVDHLALWLDAITANPWFHWVGGFVIGAAVGAWIIKFFPEERSLGRDATPLEASINLNPSEHPLPAQGSVNLRVEVVVDAADADSIMFHVDITNIGASDCYVHNVHFNTSAGSAAYFNKSSHAFLPPGGTISAHGAPTKWLRQSDILNLIVECKRTLEDDGIAEVFSYTVPIPRTPAIGSRINPSGWQRVGTQPASHSETQQIARCVDALGLPEGTFVLVLSENTPDGHPLIFTAGDANRFFTFNAVTRIVEVTLDGSGALPIYARAVLKHSDNGYHSVFVTWSVPKRELMLCVDDDQASSSRNA